MARFWVYIGDKIQGPVDIPSLRKVPGFNLLTQVCLEGEQTWRMADEVIEIKSYFISPPRLNSFTIETGNTVPKLDPFPKPEVEELTLPEPNTLEQISGAPLNKKAEPAAAGASSSALRAVCEVCGYKNPRDVVICMKCGEKLKGAPKPSTPPISSTPAAATQVSPGPVAGPDPVAPIAAVPTATEVDLKASTMVEISMSKLIAAIVAAALVAGGSFFGFRSWKKRHSAPSRSPMSEVRSSESASQTSKAGLRTLGAAKRPGKHYDHPPVHRRSGTLPSALPGIAANPEQEPVEKKPPEEKEAPSYHVISEATPLQKRYSSPLNSPYAIKHRADQKLWTTQEGQAIEQVQRTRIYGGQRTIQRNVEILMQILRDREYNTAFESGTRPSLYNDLDWSAVQKEGPLYEVRLTFSGGKENDGSPKKPLHFAFASDLERGTVEPGGQDQVRSNTLHAFFDESRIAPEERRAIAKDTEELVLASQPDASPLAFDTVVRQFAKVYGAGALSRVADAFGLEEVKKKLAHDPRLGSEGLTTPPTPASPESKKTGAPSRTPPPPAIPMDAWIQAGMKTSLSASSMPNKASGTESKSAEGKKHSTKTSAADGIEFQMETGSGRERTLSVHVVSHASIGRIWEILTGYDRLKQFVPDMLASEREGQDGAAAIVHITCLTRFMIFVFKLNLHLRIIEHPQQHSLEFEKIAGDYESLRGSIELATDPSTHDSDIIFHATVVPSGYMPNTKLESMARRLLVTQAGAIRAKAESN